MLASLHFFHYFFMRSVRQEHKTAKLCGTYHTILQVDDVAMIFMLDIEGCV